MKTNLFIPLLSFLLFPFLLCGQSLQDQLNNAKPGDVIEFSGTQSGHFETKVDGTASNPIIIRGTGTNALIDGGGIGSGYGLVVKHDYYRLENFSIRNSKKALYIENAHHGVAENIRMENIGQEALKVKRNSGYWLFSNCSTKNTGLSGDYGEGFYVGDADNNWASSWQPDSPHHITFLNCTATDPINDGFDIKEGAQFVKLVNCSVNWVNVVPLSDHGNSAFYTRGDDIQLINCSSDGNSSGGPAFKHFQTDASDGVRYGFRIELKEVLVKNHAGDAFRFHRNDIAQTSALYNDYVLQNVSGNLWGSTAEAPIVAAANFVEMSWNGEGGALYASGGSGSGEEEPVAVTGVEVIPSSLSLTPGETTALTATLSPANATDQTVNWSSDNTAVATVNTNGVVTALSVGSATITVITSDGSFSDYSQLTVEDEPTEGDCSFGVPAASAIPSLEQSYDYAHVVGTGPALDNFKEFSIKWSLEYSGLYKFAINTTDGNPDYYVDLKNHTSHNFDVPQPDFTLTGSGIPGLDGDYWIAVHQGNIVWEEKSGSHLIYFSNSSTPPNCSSTTTIANRQSVMNTDLKPVYEEGFYLYPNPARNYFTIRSSTLQKGDLLEVYATSGKLLLQERWSGAPAQRISLKGVAPGIYMLKIGEGSPKLLKLMKQE